jgi:hypothetical protein
MLDARGSPRRGIVIDDDVHGLTTKPHRFLLFVPVPTGDSAGQGGPLRVRMSV